MAIHVNRAPTPNPYSLHSNLPTRRLRDMVQYNTAILLTKGHIAPQAGTTFPILRPISNQTQAPSPIECTRGYAMSLSDSIKIYK